MNKTELIDKLLHLGSLIEICNSTQTSKKAKKLAHTLLDNYLEAINYTHCCTELKDKYVPNFEEWKLINKYTQKGFYIYDENGENYMNSDLKEKYINEILNL